MDVLSYCLAKPGARQDEPWEGDIVAKVGGKIFAFVRPDAVTIKCGRNRFDADELVHVYPDDVTAASYIGRFGWNTVTVGGAVPPEELRELIDQSYEAIVAKLPKAKRPAP